MLKTLLKSIGLAFVVCLPAWPTILPEVSNPVPDTQIKKSPTLNIPEAPNVNASSYILIDANSGKILAEKNADEALPPASLTKIMTVYVISEALKNHAIKLDDKVRISRRAWRTGGSRTFVQEGTEVPVKDLIMGIVVQSGNDASVAMAEHVAGSEEGFADLMNQQAKLLGMSHSHFTNSTGLPDPDLYTSARDLAILSRATILRHPEDYKWYAERSFTYNNITQPNRNQLLWRNPHVDGIKTGHTDAAGYCLVSSAQKGDMRLIAVVMGANSSESRSAESQRLLNYGFRFYETEALYEKQQPIKDIRVWKGKEKTVPIGVSQDLYVTFPHGQYDDLHIDLAIPTLFKAPIEKNQQVGTIKVTLGDEVLANRPVIALESSERANIFKRILDGVSMRFYSWFKKS